MKVDERGFIPVDAQQRTNVPHIFAIGDVAGEPMLAHKATHEGKVAAEVIAGENVAFDARAIPSVAYTDPEVAWAGLTETEAKARRDRGRDRDVPVGGVAAARCDRPQRGPDQAARRAGDAPLLGAGIVGANAGELIAEAVLAIEMGATPRTSR